MNILKLLFELFLFYMLYKLVFDFIIPVYRASKRMKSQMAEMQEKMRQQQQQNQGYAQSNVQQQTTATSSPKPAPSDYIDFEEVK